MRVIVLFCCLGASSASDAATVELAVTDCGDVHASAKINQLQPSTLCLSWNAVTATGNWIDNVDDVAHGSFAFVAKAGPVPVLEGSGKMSKDTVIHLPIDAGTIVLHRVTSAKKGPLALSFDVNLTSKALINLHVQGKSNTGKELFCLNIHTQGYNHYVNSATLAEADTVAAQLGSCYCLMHDQGCIFCNKGTRDCPCAVIGRVCSCHKNLNNSTVQV